MSMETILLIMVAGITVVAVVLSTLLALKIIKDDDTDKQT
jgi:hypothetical protein